VIKNILLSKQKIILGPSPEVIKNILNFSVSLNKINKKVKF
tara:strand:+ start:642 stop:764 length:123 start_codon:yes stop_codon:yes gene_type:complete